MNKFPSIEEAHNILDDIAESLPKEVYKGLNGGIILSEETLEHEESSEERPLYILGQYIIDNLGKRIKIYYGSIEKIYFYSTKDEIKEKLREVLIHELTHHIEFLAGEKDLLIEDHIFMEEYRKEK